ncbi:MAG: vWA domain-containing protein [Myxococcota bacterium]
MSLVLLVISGCSDSGLGDAKESEDWYTGAEDSTGATSATDETTEEPDDTDEPEEVCEDAESEAVTVWLSADDSNSQAAATRARALVEEGASISAPQRVWEYLNYYDFDFEPADEGSLRVVSQMRGVEDGRYDLLVAVVAPAVDPAERRPLNLTFSVDTSGSMQGDPLDRAKDTMRAIASELREGDVVSMVSWSDDTDILLDSWVIGGPDDATFVDAIESLETGGSTNLSAGLEKAYDVASRNYAEGRTNRVVLVSDGGANTGETDEALIARHADDAEREGIYLVGVGASEPGAYDDTLMDTVTDVGRGAHLFVDSPSEALRSFTGARLLSNLEVAARDVRLSMTLPPDFVVTKFDGEQIGTDEDDVIPQHLAPNDAMLYRIELADCGDARDGGERFDFSVDWEDPRTAELHTDVASSTLAEMTDAATTQVLKAQAIVAYAEALPGVWREPADAREAYLDAVYETVEAANRARPDDTDLLEILDLVATYRARL